MLKFVKCRSDDVILRALAGFDDRSIIQTNKENCGHSGNEKRHDIFVNQYFVDGFIFAIHLHM